MFTQGRGSESGLDEIDLRSFDEDFVLRDKGRAAQDVLQLLEKAVTRLDRIGVNVNHGVVIAYRRGAVRQILAEEGGARQRCRGQGPAESPVELDDQPSDVFFRENRLAFPRKERQNKEETERIPMHARWLVAQARQEKILRDQRIQGSQIGIQAGQVRIFFWHASLLR
jgi:hypothetical protein